MPALSLFGGDEGARTPDLDSAIVALSQLSYVPMGGVQYSMRRSTAQGGDSLWTPENERSVGVDVQPTLRYATERPRFKTAI
jgi:hypothetical protein